MNFVRWLFGVENDSEMMDLVFTRKGSMTVPAGTGLYQVKDGTMFFHYYGQFSDSMREHRLYVRSKLKDADAQFPGKQIRSLITNGDFIYFRAEDKIYRAVFKPQEGITVSSVRKLLECEETKFSGLITRHEYTRKFIYRLYDNPESDAIFVKLKDDDLDAMAVHRGRIIYFRHDASLYLDNRPRVVTWNDNFIVIKIRGGADVKYCDDSSPFIYLSGFVNDYEHVLYALDTRTMTILAGLKVGYKCISRISSIANGLITGYQYDDGYPRVVTAQLPTAYWEAQETATV